MDAVFSLTPLNPPIVSVIPVDEFKRHARIIGRDGEIDTIKEFLLQAEDYITSLTNHCFQPRTYLMALDRPPQQYGLYKYSNLSIYNNQVDLPRFPLMTVTSVNLHIQGAYQAFTDYQVSSNIRPGRISPTGGTFFPFTDAFQMEGMRITFTAGYTALASVPPRARFAIKALAAYWYNCREFAETQNVVGEIPVTLKNLIYGLR